MTSTHISTIFYYSTNTTNIIPIVLQSIEKKYYIIYLNISEFLETI